MNVFKSWLKRFSFLVFMIELFYNSQNPINDFIIKVTHESKAVPKGSVQTSSAEFHC